MEKALLHIACPMVAIFDEVYPAYEWLRRVPNCVLIVRYKARPE